jgi:transcriptional regulator with XRE-family HTH domain
MGAMEFREWLRRQIEERRLSVRMLALYSGLSNAAISEWLSGKRHPRPESLRRLAKGLRLPHEEVLRVAGYLAPDSSASHEEALSPLEREVIATVRALPPAVGRSLLNGLLTTARGLLEQLSHETGSGREGLGDPSPQAHPTPASR